MKRVNGYGIRFFRMETLSQEKKTEVFIYLAWRHLLIRHFPGQIEFAWHSKEGNFQWAFYLKTKYPFFRIYTRKEMLGTLDCLPKSPMKIFPSRKEMNKEYERQYWEDVDSGLFDNKCETCPRLETCDDDICP